MNASNELYNVALQFFMTVEKERIARIVARGPGVLRGPQKLEFLLFLFPVFF